MLVEVMDLPMLQKTVLSPIPSCSLKMTSKRIPEINKTPPNIIEIFKYFSSSLFLLNIWDNIKNSPKSPKNIISFPFDEPIKNKYVIGLIIGLNMSVTNIIPAKTMNKNPIIIVLLTFINNNLSFNTLNN